jgi:hypothetical protein
MDRTFGVVAQGGIHRVLWPLTARPSFVIIGAQKAGTTSLYDYLGRVPGIRSARRKEVHYFDENHQRGRSWYASQFPLTPRPGRERWITGEASPYYLLHPHAPVRLAAELPAAKLIVMLRNPVDRAYSAWSMRREMGIESRTFEQALDYERAFFPSEDAALRADPRRDTRAHRLSSYAVRGLYLDQLRAWEAQVPRERIHVMLSERLFADPDSELGALHAFLGVPASPAVSFPSSNVGRYDGMAPGTRARLDAEFHEPNAALAEHLAVDLRALGWS